MVRGGGVRPLDGELERGHAGLDERDGRADDEREHEGDDDDGDVVGERGDDGGDGVV